MDTATETKKGSSTKKAVQALGTRLSGMVMPNIGAFIAWGLMTAIFMAGGWAPNAHLAKMTSPMVTYLIPLLIAYSGGAAVYEHRGGVVGAIATIGVIVGTNVPMFIGAMIMGPCSAWLMKKFDQYVQPRIHQGFEMLVNNFSAGILGMLLAIVGYMLMGPIIEALSQVMGHGVNWMIHNGLLFIVNIFIEPAKILFLNNAINHGILTPLGTEAAKTAGKSILFLLEADPGPGLGVLIAYAIFGKGTAKASAPSAMIVHFLGGIHEIYFPYILMKPILVLAVMAGGVTGTTLFSIFNAGLRAPASPGSILAIFAMSPKDVGNYVALAIGVLGATAVSFLVASVILKRDKTPEGADALAASEAQMAAMKADAKGKKPNPAEAKSLMQASGNVKKIIFACDAGMGSSAMGASILRDKVKKAGLNISVTNTAISNLKDEDGLLVVTQEELAGRAKDKTPDAVHVAVDNFMASPKYDEIVASLKTKAVSDNTPKPKATNNTNSQSDISNIDVSKVKVVDFLHNDQNIGSATMGESTFKNKLHAAGKNLEVNRVEVGEINDDDSVLVIASKETARRIKLSFANVQVLTVANIVEAPEYDELIEKL